METTRTPLPDTLVSRVSFFTFEYLRLKEIAVDVDHPGGVAFILGIHNKVHHTHKAPRDVTGGKIWNPRAFRHGKQNKNLQSDMGTWGTKIRVPLPTRAQKTNFSSRKSSVPTREWNLRSTVQHANTPPRITVGPLGAQGYGGRRKRNRHTHSHVRLH